MTDDLTFITNEDSNKLLDRFKTLIKDTEFFDCLVGYFYSSGFNCFNYLSVIYKTMRGYSMS